MVIQSTPLRTLAWFLIALMATGCSSWQASHLPGATSPAAIQPDPVKLRLADHRTVTLHDWTLEGDSLRGGLDAWENGARVRKPETIALSSVEYREGGAEGEVLPDYLAAKQAEVTVAREQASAPAPPTKYPGVHRFKLVGGSTIELEYATVDGDSLRGWVPVTSADPSHRLVTLARKNVLYVESYKADTGKTVGLVALIGAVALGALFVWALTTVEEW